MPFEKIKTDRKALLQFRKDFFITLEGHNEFILEPISTKDIINVFTVQGYWSGISYRIYYDNGIFRAEEKIYD